MKQDKKARTIFDLATDSLIGKHETISIRLKIRISQLIVKILLKQRSLDQVRHCLIRKMQIWHYFFDLNR